MRLNGSMSFAIRLFCGSRTDLFNKWFKAGPEEIANEYLQELLRLTGQLIDGGDTVPIVEVIVLARSKAYAGAGRFVYDTGPFATLEQPLSESRVALLTTTGHFAEGDDPDPFGVENLTQDQVVKMSVEMGKADPTLSEVPVSTTRDRTRVRHTGYDIRAAEADRNTSFPIDRMLELKKDGVIGKFVDPAFSFVGLTSQLRLCKQIAPAWAERAKSAGALWRGAGSGLTCVPRVGRARSQGV